MTTFLKYTFVRELHPLCDIWAFAFKAAPPLPDGYVLREMCKSDYRKAWKNGVNERETTGNMKKGDCIAIVGLAKSDLQGLS